VRCKECLHQGLGHDEKKERPHEGGQRSKERGRESLHQTVLICQPTDTRLRGDDRDFLGTVTLTAKDFRRILTHGHHFPFFTVKEREEGGAGHWETKVWETCDIEVWDTTRDLGFPVTKDKDIVQSTRDVTGEGVLTSLSLRRSYVTTDRYWRKRLRRRSQTSVSGPYGCPMQNAWVVSFTGFTDHERHRGNRGCDLTLSRSCRLLLVRMDVYIVTLSGFYSYRIIGKLTVFLQFQEFSERNQTWELHTFTFVVRLS
jgi:hypothetical protein